jgi:phage/conjugal plasmid C-4 type zinc finger TraR family protein
LTRQISNPYNFLLIDDEPPQRGAYKKEGNMDEIDIAQANLELLLSAKIASHRSRITTAGTGALDCEECAEEIPERRRQAMPGCTLCVHCQAKMEATTP